MRDVVPGTLGENTALVRDVFGLFQQLFLSSCCAASSLCALLEPVCLRLSTFYMFQQYSIATSIATTRGGLSHKNTRSIRKLLSAQTLHESRPKQKPNAIRRKVFCCYITIVTCACSLGNKVNIKERIPALPQRGPHEHTLHVRGAAADTVLTFFFVCQFLRRSSQLRLTKSCKAISVPL